MGVENWTPEVADVGAEMRARTKDSHGEELGTFTEDTRPTEAEVALLIPKAVAIVAGSIGTDPCSDELLEQAKAVAILRVAMMIERGYYPEQINTDRSPYNAYRDDYKDQLKDLVSSVAEQCGGDGTTPAGSGGLPRWNFGGPPQVGRDTRL